MERLPDPTPRVILGEGFARGQDCIKGSGSGRPKSHLLWPGGICSPRVSIHLVRPGGTNQALDLDGPVGVGQTGLVSTFSRRLALASVFKACIEQGPRGCRPRWAVQRPRLVLLDFPFPRFWNLRKWACLRGWPEEEA